MRRRQTRKTWLTILLICSSSLTACSVFRTSAPTLPFPDPPSLTFMAVQGADEPKLCLDIQDARELRTWAAQVKAFKKAWERVR